MKLQTTSDRLAEKKAEEQALQEKILKTQIAQDVHSALDNQVNPEVGIDAIAKSLSETIATRLDHWF